MPDEYLPDGFSCVDSREDLAAYEQCLLTLDSQTSYKKYKQKSYELLRLNHHDFVLDAGCGLGDDINRLAEHWVPNGLAVGIDLSQALLSRAKMRQKEHQSPLAFCQATLTHLPFQNHAFSGCRVDRVLQYIDNPTAVLKELLRVLKPGGRLIGYDNDWLSFSFSSENPSIAKIIEKLWANAFIRPIAGRELELSFTEAGLIDISMTPIHHTLTNFTIANQIYNIEETVRKAVTQKLISEKEGKSWLESLVHLDNNKNFAVHLTAYLVAGQKPHKLL